MKRQLIAGAAVLALALVPTTMAGATTQQYAPSELIEKWLAPSKVASKRSRRW